MIADFAEFDARIFVEEEDPRFYEDGQDGTTDLGPNPKIRNMSRAYREAKSDVIWIVDCNVWIGAGVASQMIDLLCGLGSMSNGKRKKYKFVHQLPLSVDLSPPNDGSSLKERILRSGGLLEETFLSTSHAKFYTAINAVAVAPCIVGKSNMFRRSHLDALTAKPTSVNPNRDPSCGIDHFSFNICEDHLLASLLWYAAVPASILNNAQDEASSPDSTQPSNDMKWGNHAMLPPTSPGNLAIQPMVDYALRTYIDRRVRWLRVRKFTVTMATLVEPGTESLLCSAYAAWALTTIPWFHHQVGIPATWTVFVVIWLISIVGWACVDRWVWRMLHGNKTEDIPPFLADRTQARPLSAWAVGWIAREILALPIWTWAFFGGLTVVWRGRRFWVGIDMLVHELDDPIRHQARERRQREDDVVNAGDVGSGGESGRKRRRD